MPKGMPVATFAIGEAGAANAALFAVAMLASGDPALRAQLDAFRAQQTEAARAMALPRSSRRRYRPSPAGRRRAVSAILPGATLGVLGGGQLGPHVRARGAAHGLLHGGARSRCRQPGRAA